MRVLVVEDDPQVGPMVRRALERDGYSVDLVDTGDDGLWMATENEYQAVVLDIGLPGSDGLEVCRGLRERQRWAPILFLTGRDSVEDRVAGLDAGADDYLPKPFSITELSARVRALTRRAPRERPTVLEVDDITLDPASHRITRAGTEIELTAKEFALLHLLMSHAGEVVSRSKIIEQVWDFAYDGTSNVVDVYMRYLREKVDRPFGRSSIETVRGVGYRLTPG